MDEARFSAGNDAYAAADWKMAAREYLAAIHGSPPLGSGLAYHQAGNALMRLKRYGDAATVYGHALKDPGYDRRGIVFANLGAALAAAGRRDDAISAYDAALADGGYPTTFKALQGKAAALYDLGRYEEAGVVYRQAAWAEGNPDPGKALNNLGLCFMATGKPEEAVEPYRAALGVEGYPAKGKAAANLGLAYAQMGFHEEAVREFEAARDTHHHELTGSALAAYEASLAAARPDRVAGESAPSGGPEPAVTDEGATGEAGATEASSSWGEEDEDGDEPSEAIEEGSRFFTMTEDEMRSEDRDERRRVRVGKRTPKALLIRIGIVVAVIAVIAGGLSALVYFGFGYPTQEQTVGAMLDAYHTGRSYADLWVAVPQTDVRQEMRQLPARFVSYTIQGVDRAALKSTARVALKLDTGATLGYDVLLVREGVGWKVNGIKNAWGN